MVAVCEDLHRLSRLPPPVPRVLCPKICSKIRFHKSVVEIGDRLADPVQLVSIVPSTTSPFRLASQVKVHRVGVVFAANSCCASGVNNALSGMYAYMEESGRLFEVMGFAGGPHAMPFASSVVKIGSLTECSRFNNLGGTELLGYSSFDGVDLDAVKTSCMSLGLTSLVIVAASDELPASASLASLLAPAVCVAIIPQSRNQHVFIPQGICSTSLGFDSARRILAEFAGNIAVDCISSKKYWHFINCGDAALVAEVALLIRANLTVTESDKSVGIADWVTKVADLIESRVAAGTRSGVVMVSQCAFTRTDEMDSLRKEIAAIPAFPVPEHMARKQLSKPSFALLDKLPVEIKQNLLRKRDSHGLPKLSYWSPEEYLIDLVEAELKRRTSSVELAFRAHFLAHESRCPVPTDFDCILGSTLGRTAAAFIVENLHGYLVSVKDLHKSVDEWIPCGVETPASDSSLLWQRGYSFSPPVAAALTTLEPQWASQSRYRSFGPHQLSQSQLTVDPDFLPLSVMAQRGDIISFLDPSTGPDCVDDTQLPERTLNAVQPAISIPLRRIADMSPLEERQRQYLPRIPGYLSSPFGCIDSDICPRVCADPALLASVFEHSSRILPVDIINLASAAGASTLCPSAAGAAWRLVDEDDDGSILTTSDNSDTEGGIPPSALPSDPTTPCRVETHVGQPHFQRFVQDLAEEAGGRLMSPRSSARTLPPRLTQLVRCNDAIWSTTTAGEHPRLASIESTISTITRGRCEKNGLKVGVVFMCSQVPGCHNVVTGLFDYLAGCSPPGQLLGFLGGGIGLRHGWHHVLTKDLVERYRNQGGQDLLGHFGESLESEADYVAAVDTIRRLSLDGLVIVGNLEGQLTGALLTERLLTNKIPTRLITVSATAENEIPFVRQSIGCDTVTRVFSNAIANLWTECHSSRHRWYFVRLMSHHVSHLALECALATHPNIVLVTEEVAARKQSLAAITEMIADCMCARSAKGKDYGIVLIPDGVVAAIPEIRRLLRELDRITAKQSKQQNMNIAIRLELVQAQLSRFSSVIFKQLPRFVQTHLLNGTRHSETARIDIANVAMERVLQSLVGIELEKRRRFNHFSGKIDILVHSLAHQGRSSLPTAFDCDLAYTCGYTSGILVDSGRTGLVVNVDFKQSLPSGEFVWTLGALPLVALCGVSNTIGHVHVFIEPTKLVMSGQGCRALLDALPPPEFREGRHPGPYQYTSRVSWQLCRGNLDAWGAFEGIAKDCREILTVVGVELGNNTGVLEAVVKSLENIVSIITQIESKGVTDAQSGSDWFLTEPDDILSTCTPTRVMSKSRK